MDKPDQRLFEADVASAEFRAGALKGYWGLAGTDVLPEQPAWPDANSLDSGGAAAQRSGSLLHSPRSVGLQDGPANRHVLGPEHQGHPRI